MNQTTSLAQLNTALDHTPVVYEGEPLLLAELDNLVVERNIWRYVQQMDELTSLPVERMVLLGPASDYFDRWPVLGIDNKIPSDLAQFNCHLFTNYDQVRQFAFCQSHIADCIVEDLDADVIVLLLIDGLSFVDWAAYPGVQSCLVEGPTITPVGFRNIIGQPSIARRLFEKGIRRRMGFSHWERSERLTNLLFRGFDPSTQMFQVSEFKEVLLALGKLAQEQTYVQILTNGLDAVSHRHRDRPPVEVMARHLYENVLMALVERLRKTGMTALVYAVADHGILWKPEPDECEAWPVVRDERTKSHRYAKGALLTPHSRQFSCYGTNYTALAYPYLFRSLNSLEWGIHGGISFQESVVPFVKLEVI